MKRRPLAGAGARDRVARRLVDGEHVAAVDARPRDPVAGRLVDERLGARLRRERRRDRPLVVVAEEDERRAHHGGEVGALVERALGGGAVAEEGQRAGASRRAAASPTRARPRAAPGSRSGRRSRRGCSRPGSTSRRDGRATTRGSSPPASRAGARSPTRGSSGRSSRRPRARAPRRPGSPRGPRRSRTSRSGPGCGRRPSARRRCAAAPSSGRARAAPARRRPRPRRPGWCRRRRSRGGGRAPRASCSPFRRARYLSGKRERPREHRVAAGEEVGGGRLDRARRPASPTACRPAARTPSTTVATWTVRPVRSSVIAIESPHWLGAPPAGSPTMRALVARSTSATKFPAAEKVERPVRRTSLRCRSRACASTSSSGPYVVLLPPWFSRTSTMTRRTRRLARERDEPLGDVVRSVPSSAGSRGRRPCRPPASSATGRSSRLAEPDRVADRRQRRRRSAERRRDLARVDRLERRLAAVRERERGRVALDDPEAAQHLGGRRGTPAGASGSPTRCRAARAAAPARRPRRSACRRSRSRVCPVRSSAPSEPTTWRPSAKS